MRSRALIIAAFFSISGYSNVVPAQAISGTLLAEYEGAEFCSDCHDQQYDDWITSGHRFILMAGVDAQHRPLPLPGGKAWDDISYVIGGYKTKTLYLDNEGYIITTTFDEGGDPLPGANQYNNLVGFWSDYHAGEENKPYDCGSCHTTNWVANEDPTDLSGNQDGLPGIWGTFDEGGVQCEQCHGNGMTMEIDNSVEACGRCHHRTAAPGSEDNVIPASGGFIRDHEQYNEHLAGAHGWGDCVMCHNPHKRSELSIKEGAQCGVSCHANNMESYSSTPMFDIGVTCKDCHMPYATKSAQPLGPHQGDLQTHIFYIDTDPAANMFTEDGLLVALDENGKAAVTMDFACQRCHQDTSLDELAFFANNFHRPRFSISGTVEDNSNMPLADVGIEVRNVDGEHLFELSTGPDGAYQTNSVVDGIYFVQTRDEPLGLGRELYDDHLCLPASQCDNPSYVAANATAVVVAGADVSGIDFVLEVPAGGLISGQVTDADAGIPMLDVYMNLLDDSNEWFADTYTDALGNYYFTGLADGVYKVYAVGVPEGYVEELFDGDHCPVLDCDLNVSGTPITISGGGVAADTDIMLDYSGTRLLGTITRSDTGEPVSAEYAHMGVDLFSEAGKRVGGWPTNRAGQYQITLPDSGNYYLATLNDWNYHGLVNEAWDDVKCNAVCDPLTLGANLIPVAHSTTVVADFLLDPEVVFSDGFE